MPRPRTERRPSRPSNLTRMRRNSPSATLPAAKIRLFGSTSPPSSRTAPNPCPSQSRAPDGARLSAGTDNGDGTWSLTPDQLIGLTITPPSDSDADFTLTVTATSTGGSDAAAASENLVVVVQPVSDAPMLDVVAASGLEDTAIPLDVRASLTDATEILADHPCRCSLGAVLSSGTDQGNGTWSLTPASSPA